MVEAIARLTGAAAVLVFAAFLLVMRARMRRRSATKVSYPSRYLLVYHAATSTDEPPGGMIDLAATIVSPPAMQAPISGLPCSFWELSLLQIVPGSYDSDDGFSTVWVTARGGDLVLEYDERRDIARNPASGRTAQTTSGPGRIVVAGDKITNVPPGSLSDKPVPGLSFFRGGSHQPANPDVLERIGLPPALLANVRASPHKYVVREAAVRTGEFLRLAQTPRPEAAGNPDPEQPYFVYPMSQAEIGAVGTGCLDAFLLVIALILGAIGAVVVFGSIGTLVSGG